jgi:hypothetical protein
LLNSPLHGTLIADAPLELLGDVLGYQIRICIRGFNLFDIEINFLANQGFQAGTQFLDILTFATDQNTRLGGMNGYFYLSGEALDLNPGNAGFISLTMHQPADFKILMQLGDIIFTLSIPTTFPRFIDFQTKTNWIYFSTHNISCGAISSLNDSFFV